MKTSTMLLAVGAAGVIGYFLYRKYQDNQRAAAHPVVIPSDASLIRPLPFDPSIVSDVHLAV